ncbi:stage III sporulation protein AF [Wukongibacter baidiensis]|uniref:stage III sporulation protein AF n=1 Tax=Wukongibacter baidiensis TaxID=1723361 RepID=UPI003D7FA060
MIEIIKDWITNIVTIIILISFLELLMPDGKIKKYVNLILGFIVMLVILNPILDILNNKGDIENEVFTISSELSKSEYAFVTSNIESRQMDQLSALYKDRIKKDIAYRVESKYDVKVTEVSIEIEDKGKGKIGEIKKLEMSVAEKTESSKDDTIPIVKIDVSDSNIDEESKKSNNNNQQDNINIDLRNKIRDDVSNIYNLNKKSVVIRK